MGFAETNTDWGQKLKSAKETFIFGAYGPIVLVVVGGEASQGTPPPGQAVD